MTGCCWLNYIDIEPGQANLPISLVRQPAVVYVDIPETLSLHKCQHVDVFNNLKMPVELLKAFPPWRGGSSLLTYILHHSIPLI